MNKTTLVVMAAGIGSRFGGGVKQLTAFGPNGEIIIDYSIYDALAAGFDKVVFVIRKDLEKDFREVIGRRIERQTEVAYAFQELSDLPQGFALPEGRTKPWGTGQAVLSCRGLVEEPFAVINADDYYGKSAFQLVHDYLADAAVRSGEKFSFCMAGFQLKNTLSSYGGVTRGLCRLNEEHELIGVEETRDIIKTSAGPAILMEDGTQVPLDGSQLVSMNFWGFTPDFIEELSVGFVRFLENLPEEPLTQEYLLPTIMDQMLKENRVDIAVLQSQDQWFGVTYREDVPLVIANFRKLLDTGAYPAKLWR